MPNKTASVLVLRDNVHRLDDPKVDYLIRQLGALSYDVKELMLVSDRDIMMPAVVQSSFNNHDIVIYMGTFSGYLWQVLGQVFNQKLVFNEKLAQLLNVKDCGNGEIMNIPMYAKILEFSNAYPIVYVRGLLVITDDDELLKPSFVSIAEPFLENYNRKPLYKRVLTIKSIENNYCSNVIPRKDNVNVSYAIVDNKTAAILTSACLPSLLSYEANLMSVHRDNIVKSEEGTDISGLVYNQTDPRVRISIEAIEECFKKYGPENVFLSFNGGKDCTVLLHIALGVLKKNYPNYTEKLLCVYVEGAGSFSELNNFVGQCEQYYNLNVIKLSKDIKESLEFVLKNRPNMKACLMGTRRTDPQSEHLRIFHMTDSNWPQLMRVSPLLDWHYTEIWDYLLFLKVPYCSLYDVGYTSLDSVENTIKNPMLNISDDWYLPAYKLLDVAQERYGRQFSLPEINKLKLS